MAWSTPRTWTVGETLTAANMNTYLSNELSALVSYGTSLPASPVDGTPYTLVDSTTAPTYAWQMRYVSGAAKWYFVGGSASFTVVNTAESPASTGAWVDLTTAGPSFVVPRAGIYEVTWGADAFGTTGSVGSTSQVSVFNQSNVSIMANTISEVSTTASQRVSGFTKGRTTSLAASDTIKLRYQAGNTNASFANRVLSVVPVSLT